MKYKAVIFDFNGTLFWDTQMHNLAWDIFLQKHRISLSDEEKTEKIHGRSNVDILMSLFKPKPDEKDLSVMAKEKERIYHDICLKNRMEFAPGATGFMSFLKNKQIPYTLATSSDWTNIAFYLKHMDLAKWFEPDKMVYENGSFRSKPSPDIFLLASEKAGVAPTELIIFEDSPTGILAAENAGAGKIIIVNSTRKDFTHLPYQVISSFDEVDRALFMV
jgi:HAD superfamily hydrolase (TIGR01509 family)